MNYKVGDVFSYEGDNYEITSISRVSIWAQSVETSPVYFNLRTFLRPEFEEHIKNGKIAMGIGSKVIGGKKMCFHSWKRYTGFNEIYDYCSHCDAKKEVSWKELRV